MFDSVSGSIQRLGFDGASRLTRQPWLRRRYLIDGMPITADLAVGALRARWHRPQQVSLPSPSGGFRVS